MSHIWSTKEVWSSFLKVLFISIHGFIWNVMLSLTLLTDNTLLLSWKDRHKGYMTCSYHQLAPQGVYNMCNIPLHSYSIHIPVHNYVHNPILVCCELLIISAIIVLSMWCGVYIQYVHSVMCSHASHLKVKFWMPVLHGVCRNPEVHMYLYYVDMVSLQY